MRSVSSRSDRPCSSKSEHAGRALEAFWGRPLS
jgi:hypothetical protein